MSAGLIVLIVYSIFALECAREVHVAFRYERVDDANAWDALLCGCTWPIWSAMCLFDWPIVECTKQDLLRSRMKESLRLAVFGVALFFFAIGK